ncbi:uncharacterized protein JCM6883_007381 [Sporobolomyces salmoneus]|uniref:uncharacterized protein n=1 Tax=Sporobolomyces salmoneus TaxID=183962 RepID=UPI00316D6589
MSTSTSPHAPPTSTSQLLLYATSSTLLLITLFVVVFPIYLVLRSSRTFNSTNELSIALGIASTLALGLHGVCGLVALGQGSLGAAIAGGVFGALSLFLVDVQAIVSCLSFKKGWKKSFGVIVPLCLLLVSTTVLHIVLLSIDEPTKETLFRISHARGVLHLVFDLFLVGIVAKKLSKGDHRQQAKSDIECQRASNSSTLASNETKLGSRVNCRSSSLKDPSSSRIFQRREFPLLVPQLLSTILSILSISLPIVQNYLPLDSNGIRFVSPTVFGSTTTSSGSLVLSIFVLLRWLSALFVVHPRSSSSTLDDVETGSIVIKRSADIEPRSAPPPARPSLANRKSEGASTFHTLEPTTSMTSERLLTSRSRSHSVTSFLSLGANLPPRISEEGEHSKSSEDEDDDEAVTSGQATESSEDYVQTELHPAPFVVEEENEEIVPPQRPFSPGRPRSASSPEPFYTRPPVSAPRPPSPVVVTRKRKDAGRLARPVFDRSFSSPSLLSSVSPVLVRPSLEVDTNPDDSFHSATSHTPAALSLRSESGHSTPSPTKPKRRPSLRSLVGVSKIRRPSGESPTSFRKVRHGSRSSSRIFLRGGGNELEPVTPTLEIETDESDPFAAVQASQAIEATKKVEMWEEQRRKASTATTLTMTEGGGFEEDIEIVSPIRENFAGRFKTPVRITTTSALANLQDPTLYPRRARSASNSRFVESLPSLPPQEIKLNGYRSRSGSLGSAITLSTKVDSQTNESTYRFGKNFENSPSLSPTSTSTSTKLLEAMGLRSPPPSRPPRANSLSSRPLSTQVEQKGTASPEELRARARSRTSAPVPSSSTLENNSSPRISPVRKLFVRRPSGTVRLFSPTPPMSNSPEVSTTHPSRKGSRASSTVSTASFSLSKLRRGSSSARLRPSLTRLFSSSGGGGGGASQISIASLGKSASSDLSFMCRGEGGGSSYQSSLRQGLSRSVSLDFGIVSSSSNSSAGFVSSSELKHKEEIDGPVEVVDTPRSPSRTTNWWSQGTSDSRPLTPYRSSRLRTTSAPAPQNLRSSEDGSQDGDLSGSEQARGRKTTRSQSLPFSFYRLEAPSGVSPIGSLLFDNDDDNNSIEGDSPPTSTRVSSALLAPPISLAQPSSKSSSARSSLSLSLSRIQVDFKSHSKTISSDDVQELTELCETFTPPPLETVSSSVPSRSSFTTSTAATTSHNTIETSLCDGGGLTSPETPGLSTSFSPSTIATLSPSLWPGAELLASPTLTQTSSSNGSPLPSPALSLSKTIEYEFARTDIDAVGSYDFSSKSPRRGGTMVDYWLEKQQKDSDWIGYGTEGEELIAVGESDQMI